MQKVKVNRTFTFFGFSFENASYRVPPEALAMAQTKQGKIRSPPLAVQINNITFAPL